MKKTLFLLAVCAFGINCGGGGANTAANKPATNAPATNANKPASTPAPSNTASNSDKKETAGNPDLDFKLVNKTGYDIKELSIGPTGDTEWTKDDEVLKGKTFKDGESLDIKFHPKATAENWDMKVEWTDGSKGVEWLKLNLTKIEKITLKYNRDTDVTTAEYE